MLTLTVTWTINALTVHVEFSSFRQRDWSEVDTLLRLNKPTSIEGAHRPHVRIKYSDAAKSVLHAVTVNPYSGAGRAAGYVER
jgi:hypothetical protein